MDVCMQMCNDHCYSVGGEEEFDRVRSLFWYSMVFGGDRECYF